MTPEIPDLQITSSPVTSTQRKLRTKWTISNGTFEETPALHKKHGLGTAKRPNIDNPIKFRPDGSKKWKQCEIKDIVLNPTPMDMLSEDTKFGKGVPDGQDLRAIHNIDAEQELVAMMSKQIAEDIDNEIINSLVQI